MPYFVLTQTSEAFSFNTSKLIQFLDSLLGRALTLNLLETYSGDGAEKFDSLLCVLEVERDGTPYFYAFLHLAWILLIPLEVFSFNLDA